MTPSHRLLPLLTLFLPLAFGCGEGMQTIDQTELEQEGSVSQEILFGNIKLDIDEATYVGSSQVRVKWRSIDTNLDGIQLHFKTRCVLPNGDLGPLTEQNHWVNGSFQEWVFYEATVPVPAGLCSHAIRIQGWKYNLFGGKRFTDWNGPYAFWGDAHLPKDVTVATERAGSAIKLRFSTHHVFQHLQGYAVTIYAGLGTPDLPHYQFQDYFWQSSSADTYLGQTVGGLLDLDLTPYVGQTLHMKVCPNRAPPYIPYGNTWQCLYLPPYQVIAPPVQWVCEEKLVRSEECMEPSIGPMEGGACEPGQAPVISYLDDCDDVLRSTIQTQVTCTCR